MHGINYGIEPILEDPGYSLGTAGCPAVDQIGNPSDLYIWNNTGNWNTYIRLRPMTNPPTAHSIDYWIQEQRGYYLTQKFGYAPYTYPHPLRSGTTTTTPPPTKKGKGHGH
jgi:hypothetical protein